MQHLHFYPSPITYVQHTPLKRHVQSYISPCYPFQLQQKDHYDRRTQVDKEAKGQQYASTLLEKALARGPTTQPMVKLGKVLRISADRKELHYLPLEDIGGNFYRCTAGRLAGQQWLMWSTQLGSTTMREPGFTHYCPTPVTSTRPSMTCNQAQLL